MSEGKPGGLGGEARAEGIRDIRLVEKAIRQRWDIPVELRGRLVDQLGKVLTSVVASPREQVSAARALIAADAQNLEQERRDLQIPKYHQIQVDSPTLDRATRELTEWRRQMTERLSSTPSAPPTAPTSSTRTG